jgi:hypothetical protein
MATTTPSVADAITRVWRQITAGTPGSEAPLKLTSGAASRQFGSVPAWAWAAAGIAALYFFSQRKQR